MKNWIKNNWKIITGAAVIGLIIWLIYFEKEPDRDEISWAIIEDYSSGELQVWCAWTESDDMCNAFWIYNDSYPKEVQASARILRCEKIKAVNNWDGYDDMDDDDFKWKLEIIYHPEWEGYKLPPFAKHVKYKWWKI